jgi:hypothetical protein
MAFTNITFVVRDVAEAIEDNKTTNMNPSLMDIVGFSKESLMSVLSHLVDHKAQGTNFVGMVPPHMVL